MFSKPFVIIWNCFCNQHNVAHASNTTNLHNIDLINIPYADLLHKVSGDEKKDIGFDLVYQPPENLIAPVDHHDNTFKLESNTDIVDRIRQEHPPNMADYRLDEHGTSNSYSYSYFNFYSSSAHNFLIIIFYKFQICV